MVLHLDISRECLTVIMLAVGTAGLFGPMFLYAHALLSGGRK